MFPEIQPTESVTAYGGAGLVREEIEKLAEFQKSFYAGADINIADLTNGQAGRVQNMENTFKVITHSENAATFWRDIPKTPTSSTVLEWARINEVGQSLFYPEGGDVDAADDDMDRQYDIVRFMGIKGTVSFVAKNVKFLEDAEVRETKNKTLAFVRSLDEALWHSNSTYNSIAFNGVFKQHYDKVKSRTQNIIDLRGKRMSDKTLNSACTTVADNFGNPNGLQLWLSNAGAESWVQDKIANKTYYTNMSGGDNLNPTQRIKSFDLENGSGLVKKDVFLRSRSVLTTRVYNPRTSAFAATSDKAPTVPSSPALAVVPYDPTTGYSLDAGDYDYAVTSINRYGESVPVEATISVPSGGSRVRFTLAESSPVTGQAATGFRIYRRDGASTNPQDYYLVKEVSSGTQYDDGEFIPGTTSGALIDWDSDQVIKFAQLLPMYKLYYGVRSDKLEWLQKLYGTLQIFNANRIVVFKNIGNIPNE